MFSVKLWCQNFIQRYILVYVSISKTSVKRWFVYRTGSLLGALLERQPWRETSIAGELHHWQRGYSELKQTFLAKINICEY